MKNAPFYPSSPPPAFAVRTARWSVDEPAIAEVRRRVFIVEQGVPEALEWEAIDADCAWFVAEAGAGLVIGIARLRADGRIGRMAVLPPWRRRGVGAALLTAALSEARARGLAGVHLAAQTHAVRFYARFGFRVEGAEFFDAGIPHRRMYIDFACGEAGIQPVSRAGDAVGDEAARRILTTE